MFECGTEWIRADFHLHTKADKEFSYKGEENSFIADYVNKLKMENISLGVITNHNKFDSAEYRGIKKKAKKENITILPGVELSVKEGANGIHCLVVFKDDEWINGKSETINQFLDEVFKGIENREHENTRCNKDLTGTIECLNTYNKDYFIIMAHIEQRSGFFRECDGGLIRSLSKSHAFKSKIFGFQKGRTRDKMKQLEDWMGYRLPYIEGSDCKSIEEIGKGEKSYIKIGDGSFNSVVIAFKEHENRISLVEKKYNHGYLKSIEFIGGKMNGRKINLSPELNSLIGVRGSGKSSVIEVIRYALDMIPSDADKSYKSEVVDNLLESGGQIIVELQDNYGRKYKLKRILGESIHILDEKQKEIEITINSILQAPLYFGQKDLSHMGSGYELDLLDKLVGNKIRIFQENIVRINDQLSIQIDKLLKLNYKVDTLPDLNSDLLDIKYKINIFKEKGVSSKLSKQVNFQKDEEAINNILELIKKFRANAEKLLKSNSLRELTRTDDFDSVEVPELAKKVLLEVSVIKGIKVEIEALISKIEVSADKVTGYLESIQKTMDSLEEEFAEIKRDINIPNLNPDDYAKLKAQEEKINKSIKEVVRLEEQKGDMKARIKELVNQRNSELLEEYNAYKDEIDNINSNQKSLELDIEFKGNKRLFQNKIKETFKGSNINQHTYETMSRHYTDLAAIILDVLVEESDFLPNILTGPQFLKVKEMINENYKEQLQFITPNHIEIKYHGKSISKHSIGQRASALVLFILSQQDNNVIMIDQPEDDLDNQVIYNEIITKVKERKPEVQFIFATHNANIPVLGDSEQVIALSYTEKQIIVESGSIDNKSVQNKIVDIMEGGQEAFNKRTDIYNLWKN